MDAGAGADRFRGNGMLSFYVDPKVVDPEARFPTGRGALRRLLQERQTRQRRRRGADPRANQRR